MGIMSRILGRGKGNEGGAPGYAGDYTGSGMQMAGMTQLQQGMQAMQGVQGMPRPQQAPLLLGAPTQQPHQPAPYGMLNTMAPTQATAPPTLLTQAQQRQVQQGQGGLPLMAATAQQPFIFANFGQAQGAGTVFQQPQQPQQQQALQPSLPLATQMQPTQIGTQPAAFQTAQPQQLVQPQQGQQPGAQQQIQQQQQQIEQQRLQIAEQQHLIQQQQQALQQTAAAPGGAYSGIGMVYPGPSPSPGPLRQSPVPPPREGCEDGGPPVADM